MTVKEKLKLIDSYTENFRRLTGEYIKLAPCSEGQALATFTQHGQYWKIARVICDLTGWKMKEIFSKIRKREQVFRRSIIDFVAVNNGCSYTECARLTGRDHTTVLHSVTQFENKLDTERNTKTLLVEIMNYIKENYYIYDNVDQKDIMTERETITNS